MASFAELHGAGLGSGMGTPRATAASPAMLHLCGCPQDGFCMVTWSHSLLDILCVCVYVYILKVTIPLYVTIGLYYWIDMEVWLLFLLKRLWVPHYCP